MRPRFPRAAARLLVWLAALSAASGALASPGESWRTMETENFDIHFPDGGYEFALRTAGYLETAHERLVPLLGHRPKLRTQVVLTDDVDFANGSARVVPYPLVRGYMSPPTAGSHLGTYDDFLWLLMVHEYAHVLHLDNAGGLPELANRIVGRQLTPNHLAPRWLIEGIAVYYESLLSAGGRNDSSLADMVARAQVLEHGGLWPIDKVSGSPFSWPGGNAWYLLGGRFVAHLVERRGDVFGTAFPREYGRRALPYGLNVAAEEAVGITFTEAWEDWSSAETEKQMAVLDDLRDKGVIEGRRLTEIGRQVSSPRFEPGDETLLALIAPGDDHPAVRRFDALSSSPMGIEESTLVRRAIGAQGFDVCPEGEVLVMSIREPYRLEQRYDDLYAAPAGGGPALRLTSGLRASDPSLSADGDRLAFVSRRRGETAVYVAAIQIEARGAGRTPEVRLGTPLRVFQETAVHVDAPAFSPSGEALVFSASRSDPGRDLLLVDLSSLELPSAGLVAGRPDSTGYQRPPERPDMPSGENERMPPVIRLTDDGAQNIQPVFHPSGDYVLFASDRTGIFDLYALSMRGEETRRVTRTLTGAFAPRISHDGSTLAYVTYTAAGYDLARLRLEPEAWPAAPSPPEPRPPLHPSPSRIYPVGPYSPLPSLRPYSWSPYFGVDREGTTLGISTGGADAVGDHSWFASVWLGLGSLAPGYSARYTWRGHYPALGLASSRTEYGTSAWHVREGRPTPYEERSWRVSTSANLSLPALHRGHTLSLALTADHRRVLGGLPPIDPAEPVPLLPEDGLSTRARLSWTSSSVRRYPENHVPPGGVRTRASAELASRRLGGDFDYAILSAGVTGHRSLPVGRQQVLAANLDTGVGLGAFGRRSFFSLGGLPLDDPLTLVQNPGGRAGTPLLRGFAPFSVSGDAFVSANLEHRFPLLEPERGVGTLPVFLSRLHGATFVDVAYVTQAPFRAARGTPRAGLGAEVRADLLLGYYMTLNLRLGLARGFGPGGTLSPYFGIGSAF